MFFLRIWRACGFGFPLVCVVVHGSWAHRRRLVLVGDGFVMFDLFHVACFSAAFVFVLGPILDIPDRETLTISSEVTFAGEVEGGIVIGYIVTCIRS